MFKRVSDIALIGFMEVYITGGVRGEEVRSRNMTLGSSSVSFKKTVHLLAPIAQTNAWPTWGWYPDS